MLSPYALWFLLAVASPLIQEEYPVEGVDSMPQQIEQEYPREEDDVADRSSKNSNEYNLYDREQNRGRGSQNQQYYYYQNPDNNGNPSKKLYQRDNG